MFSRIDRAHRALPVLLGFVALTSVAVLFLWDALPRLFPAGAHNVLGAFPLFMIAVAYLVYQSAHRPVPMEVVKAILLAIAFLFWAANQMWPNLPQATLFNDIAIALFVLDVFLVMIGWPATSPGRSPTRPWASSRFCVKRWGAGSDKTPYSGWHSHTVYVVITLIVGIASWIAAIAFSVTPQD